MAAIQWSIFLHTICQRLSETRKQICKIYNSIQYIDPSDLDLDDDLEDYRVNIAWWENEETTKSVSNAIVALAWASIEITLVKTCREVADKNNIVFPCPIPDRNRLKFITDFFKKHIREVPQELHNRLSEFEMVRNCVVHAYGLIHHYRQSSKIINLAKNRKWLKISNPFPTKEDEAIIVEKEFISMTLFEIEKWLEKSLPVIGFGPRYPILK